MFARLCQMIVACRTSSAGSESFPADAEGSVALEYGLIAALVVVVVIVALVGLRANLIDLPLPAISAAFDEALS